MPSTQYALEWSKKQNAFHIHPLDAALHAAKTTFWIDGDNDYRIIHVGEKEECHKLADECRVILIERQKTQQPTTVL